MNRTLPEVRFIPPPGARILVQLAPVSPPDGSPGFWQLSGYAWVTPALVPDESGAQTPEPQPVLVPFLAIIGDHPVPVAQDLGMRAQWFGWQVVQQPVEGVRSLTEYAAMPLPPTPEVPQTLEEFIAGTLERKIQEFLDGAAARDASAGLVTDDEGARSIPDDLALGPDPQGRYAGACGGLSTASGPKLGSTCVKGGPCRYTNGGPCAWVLGKAKQLREGQGQEAGADASGEDASGGGKAGDARGEDGASKPAGSVASEAAPKAAKKPTPKKAPAKKTAAKTTVAAPEVPPESSKPPVDPPADPPTEPPADPPADSIPTPVTAEA